jgi:thiamine biosynthesis protein ThiI
MKSVVVHYQEIALKGNNRPWFIARLARNLREATSDLGVREVRVLMGRIEVLLEDDADWITVRDRIARVFGVANFAQAGRAPPWLVYRSPRRRDSVR